MDSHKELGKDFYTTDFGSIIRCADIYGTILNDNNIDYESCNAIMKKIKKSVLRNNSKYVSLVCPDKDSELGSYISTVLEKFGVKRPDVFSIRKIERYAVGFFLGVIFTPFYDGEILPLNSNGTFDKSWRIPEVDD